MLVDDFLRMMSKIFLREKCDMFRVFKWYKTRVEKETCDQLKCLRFDRRGEFIFDELTIFYNKNGIKRIVCTKDSTTE